MQLPDMKDIYGLILEALREEGSQELSFSDLIEIIAKHFELEKLNTVDSSVLRKRVKHVEKYLMKQKYLANAADDVYMITAEGLNDFDEPEDDAIESDVLELDISELELEPETITLEATEPEVTELEATEPEAIEPETTELEATEPEVTEPEAIEPEITEPEATELEAIEPEATEPETTELEATEPEATELEAIEPEINESETTEPEAIELEATEPEAIILEATEPEVTESEITELEATEPEVTEPELTESETTEPETTEPEAIELEATDPEVTESETTESETTEPETIELEATEPEITEPEITESETTEPEINEPETTELEATEPEAIEPEPTEQNIPDPTNKDTTINPSTEIEDTIRQHNQQLAEKILAEISNLPENIFELFVIDLLSKMGFNSFHNARYSSNENGHNLLHGVIIDDQTSAPIYIHAQKSDQEINLSDMQNFINAISDKGGKGVFATTAKFSEQAKELAIDKRIMLMDGMKIAGLMISHDFCVEVEKVYDVKEFDPETFSDYQK